ncbi:hypothetical protein N7532_006516 [Penicillium argentinense]|uniref:Cell wall protein n=1 Tax=Penicillium argentinense TaxID=1131581 RepID=A0A9W9FFY5_9EURO|nr:uncharacterized protein N7532_006516 [Penicillium argentinense]KAJ5099515.1 hypothetical protein N7532_006516 [Penicillium argentinense]
MPSTSFTVSSALCLLLAVGPAAVLSAPQLNGLPILGGDHDADTTPANGNSEHDAGAGFDVAIPGGPGVKFGAGTHSEHHGPCGPGINSEHDAGAGYDVSIPGGPGVRFGAGTHDQHEAVPCPEIVEEVPPPAITEVHTETYVPSYIPPTYTTPIVIPTITTPAAYAPPTPVPVTSTPLIPHPAPSVTPSQPVYNAGSTMAPSSSLMALALPIILGFFA